MKIVFLGTPEIAKVCLEKLWECGKHEILAVVTNTDKPTGRGNKLAESPVKTFAKSHGMKLLQYEKISKEGVEDLKALKPDVLVLVAYGHILSQEVLDIALPINLHGSLLPALRGPSPIQSAILNGLDKSGVTVMKIEQKMDSGDMLLQKEIKILPTDTSGTLFEKMANVGAEAILEALDLIEKGKAVWQKQDDTKATYCKMLTKENSLLDFSDTTKNIVNKIRAYNPNPFAHFVIDGEKFKVITAKESTFEGSKNAPCGEVLCASSKQGLKIATGDGVVEILELQAPNSKPMTAKAYLNGKSIKVGSKL